MRLEFDLNNNVEKPEIILGKRNYDKFGSVVHFDNLAYEYNLMSANSVSFTVYQELNGEKERLWNEIRNGRLIWLKEFNEWFEIEVTVNEDNGISKEVTGTALCEAELSQIMIRGAEINTEDDIARDEYINPTVFYKPSNPKESLLHRLLKEVPNYSIKHVDESLWNIQRTFSIDGSTVYDTLMNEIAEEIGCLFLFDSTDRSISVYDLKTNCQNCGYRADYTDICPECGSKNLNYGYGEDTTIFVDSETLAQNISLTGKQEEVKNYIRVSGGDDIMNAAIAACNPTGTQYIYTFSTSDKEDMSEELSAKLDEYLKEFDRLTPVYKGIMNDLYNTVDEQLRLESSMMPDIITAETNATKELSKLTSANLSPVAVKDISIASVYTVNNAVLGMAKCIVNSTIYKVELIDGSTSFSSQTWRGKFRLENRSDEEDTTENTDYITITINDDYSYYVKQKIQKTIDRDDVYLVDIFDIKTELNTFKAELKKYCLNRLTSFESAYQSVIEVLIEANCADYSSYGDIYNALYLPYHKKLEAIQKEIQVRAEEIKTVESRLAELEKSQAEITEYLNLEHFLGETLWKELCAFRREDSFENSNYVSNGLDNTELLKKAQELLEKAKIDAVTASTLQMSLSTSMFNLLAIPEFEKLTDMFEGGNWIRIGLDNKIYRLRLVHYKINFSEIQNIEVEFSDVTQTANGLSDVNSLMSKVQSMSGNFHYVAHQAEQGSKGFAELDKIRNDGLDAALYKVVNGANQEFVIDEHGITGKQWDDILGSYSPEQVKMINNLLVYTDNNWNTAKAALGKIQYYDPIRKAQMEKYGLIAEAVISGILMSNDIIGGHIYSENYSPVSGTHMNLNTGDFSFAGGKLVYDSQKNTLNLTGKITFEGIDYSNSETMKAVKDSLGITDVEDDIDEFNNASVLTPLEKKNMADDWKVIQEEYKKNIELAKIFGLYTNDNNNSNDDQTVINYINSYNTLSQQIGKCGLNELSTSTSIDIRIYDDIENYHIANINLANKINEKSKTFSDEAYKIAMQAVSDGVLTPSEKRDLLNEINSIRASYAKYSSICSTLKITCSEYTSTYNTLILNMTGTSSVYKLDVSDNTTLTSGQITQFKSCFNDYYSQEAIVIKRIQDSTNNNISKAQNAADKAQEDASEALGILNDIASDSKITPTEKLQLLDKFNTIKASHNEIVSAYGNSYKNIAEYTSYMSAYNSLYTMLYSSSMGILTNMGNTYDMNAGGNYSRTSYNSVISTYYTRYQTLINKITSDLQDSIESVSGITNKVQQSLGWTTEIDEKSVISPYIEGGYLNITAPSKGSVVIDPLGIKNSTHIFSVYNPQNKIVLGIDISGNGIFEGKITAKLGNIGGWNIDAYRLYMSDTGMSSYGGYYAFWAGESNGACGTINSNAKFKVGHDGHLVAENADISGKITADDGKIGGWTLNASSIYRNSSVFGAAGGMYFGINGLSIGSYFKISSGGTLTSGSTTNYVTLNDGALRFYSDGKATAKFSDGLWKGTTIYGTTVNLEDYAKFVSFGRKPKEGDSYSTTLLLNYGLNPDGRTEGIISYGSIFSAGSITTESFISCAGSITTSHSYILNKPQINMVIGTVDAWNGTSFGINNSGSGTGLYVFGNIGCSGTKERIIQTEHYGAVELNAYETATPYFGDIGSGECGEDGLCYIYLDEIFKETILTDCEYYVFLQPFGEYPVYLIKQKSDYFVVKGQAGQTFNFEIKARQRGTENMRLDRAGDRIESED